MAESFHTAATQAALPMPHGNGRSESIILRHSSRILDGLILFLLLTGPCLSGFYYGASRIETAFPFYLLTQLGLLLFCCRPVFTKSYRRLLLPPGTWIGLVFLGYLLVQWLVLSQIPYASRVELYKLLNYVAIALAWTEMSATRRRWAWLLSAIIIAASILAWYAFIQDWNESNMVLLRERPEQYGMRASSTFICPNHFAQIMAMVVVVCAGLLFTEGAGPLLRLLSLYAIPLCTYTLFLSRSRSGILGMLAGVAVVWLLIALRKSLSAFVLTILALLVLMGGLLTAAYQLDDQLRTRIAEARAGDIRLQLWPDTLDMIEASPVIGTGPGTYRHAFAPFRNLYGKADSTVRFAHNEYLHTLAEYGIVGMVLVGLFLLWLLFRFLRVTFKAERARDGALGAIVVGVTTGAMVHAVFDFQFQLFSNPQVYLLIVGAISGRLFVSGLFRPIRIGRAGIWALALLMLAGLVITGVWATQDFFTATQAKQAEAYDELLISEGWIGEDGQLLRDPDANLGRYEGMIRWNPSHWLGHSLLGRAWIAKGEPLFLEEDRLAALETGQEHLLAALERNPLDDEALLALGIGLDGLGRRDEARTVFTSLLKLEPYHIDYQLRYASILQADGDWAGALALYERARELVKTVKNPEAVAMIEANIQRCEAQLQ